MSGGSYSYIGSRLEDECAGRMFDAEMNELIKDLSEVLHELEWWQSGDCLEETYRKSVTEFKEKWFKGSRDERLKGYIDKSIEELKYELYLMIGE